MHRFVESRLDADLLGPADITLSIAVAAGADVVAESLLVLLNGIQVITSEVLDDGGGRLHCASGLGPGHMAVFYRAEVQGRADPAPVSPIDLIRYARPSRYCESDRLGAVARAEFGGLRGHHLVDAVSGWVGSNVAYIAGSSRPIDGAVSTLLSRQGVCRDFAHLVIAMLRACDTPARMVSVYAPGLTPMDFHAVAEAYVDGTWYAVDATGLAPRGTMVRIATGRDAADTAFFSAAAGPAVMGPLDVVAYSDGDLPLDPSGPACLG